MNKRELERRLARLERKADVSAFDMFAWLIAGAFLIAVWCVFCF